MMMIFLQNPISAIGYTLLMLAILSIWIYPKIWVWSPLLAASMAFAYYGNVIDIRAIIPLALVGGCYSLAAQNIKGFWRLFTTMAAAIITVALYTHYVKGFNNTLLFSNWRASIDSQPINIYANYDKAVVALLILGLYLPPLIRSKKELYNMLLKTIPWMLLTALIILPLAGFLNMIHWNPKFPSITFTWLTLQIFFVLIPEELFYRGFLQREISLRLNNPFAGPLAVLVTSLLFALLHLLFVPHLTFVLASFVASILYGTIYQITGKIESPLLTHFFVNLCHFFFFTYPVLA